MKKQVKIGLLSGVVMSNSAAMPLGAYDPEDADTKAAVQAAVDEALETAREEHSAEVQRLKDKNSELLGKLNKARQANGGDNTEEVSRLERELDETKHDLSEAQSKLRVVERDLKKVTGERDTAVTERDTERTNFRNELIENNLTAALVEHKVAPHFMDAAKALLKSKVSVEMEGDERKLLADGKPLGDFVKDWAASDAGKHYVVAPGNAGGGASGANGGQIPGGLKKLDEYSETERVEMARTRPDEWKQVLAAAGQTGENANVIQ